MNQRQIELMLKKQRLQSRSSEQRRQLQQSVASLLPLFTGAEYFRSGVNWVRRRAVVTGVMAVMLVARPRTVLRWAQRAWLVWLAWRNWNSPDKKDQRFKTRLKKYLNGRISGLFSQ